MISSPRFLLSSARLHMTPRKDTERTASQTQSDSDNDCSYCSASGYIHTALRPDEHFRSVKKQHTPLTSLGAQQQSIHSPGEFNTITD